MSVSYGLNFTTRVPFEVGDDVYHGTEVVAVVSNVEVLRDGIRLVRVVFETEQRFDSVSQLRRRRSRRRRLRVRDFVNDVAEFLGVCLTRVESSNLWAVGVDDGNLVVVFRKRRVYVYADAADHLEPLLAAESVGRHFNRTIRPLDCAEVEIPQA